MKTGTDLGEYYLSYRERFERNLPGYFGEFRIYLILLAALAFADFLSTWRFMAEGSVEDEFHPAIRMISQVLGAFFGPLLAKITQVGIIVFLTILFRPFARIILIPVIVICAHAVWYNIRGIHFYTPRFLLWFSQASIGLIDSC